EKFSPFYRMEQLIIVPHDQSPFTDDSGTLWGPAFRLEFLRSVLYLQNLIENLTAVYNQTEDHGAEKMDNGTTVTLQSICFRPLYPENDHCAVQSALQYFQNDPRNIEPANYLQHLKGCLKYLNFKVCDRDEM